MPHQPSADAVAGAARHEPAVLVVAGIWALVIHQDTEALRKGVETSATVTCGDTGGPRRLVVFDPDVQVPVEVSLPRTSRTARQWMERFRPDEGR